MKAEWSNFLQSADEQLCAMVAQGNTEAEDLLVSRYSRLVRMCSRPLFLAGGDSEDLIQEGMVGLLHAIRSYDHDREALFRTYAEVCIRSRLYSAVRAASRDKHLPLNSSISFETPLFDTAGYLSSPKENPEDVIIGKEEWQERVNALKDHLSGFEAKVLHLYLGGLSYVEIADRLGKSQKSVDNAVQRIRRKVAPQIASGEISKR